LLTFAAATFRGISTLLIDQVTYFLGNSAAGAISDIALADPNPRLVTGDKLLSLSMWSSRVAGATSGSIVLSLVQSSNNLGVSSPIVTLTSTQGVNFGLDTAPIVPNIAIDLVNNLYFLRLTLNLAAGRPNGDLGVTVVRLTVLPLSLDRR
jgi:hypothetical protein